MDAITPLMLYYTGEIVADVFKECHCIIVRMNTFYFKLDAILLLSPMITFKLTRDCYICKILFYKIFWQE